MKPLLAEDEIFITDDVTLADIKTVSDCELAEVTLTAHINDIEQQLADPAIPDDADWEARANSALRTKRALRGIVQARGSALRKEHRRSFNDAKDRLLIAEFKRLWPAQFAAAVHSLEGSSES